MPAGNVFEIALGLGLTFFLVAVLCSAIVEFISNLVRKRAKYLLRGLRDMLDTPETAESAAPADRWTGVRQDVTGEKRLYESALAATPRWPSQRSNRGPFACWAIL